MEHNIECDWQENLRFDAKIDDFSFSLDANELSGGQGKGISPKPLLLIGLAGCTGMDVISILNKMKIFPESFNVSVKGVLTEEHPKYYANIHITYYFTGSDIPKEKIQRAIELSQQNYCGVYRMLKETAKITYDIKIN